MLKLPFRLHITPFLLVLLFLAGPFFVRAQEGAGFPENEAIETSSDEGMESSPDEVVDVWRVELLTCSPGQEIYELYGHTGLRVTNGRDFDFVFNFGVFDFSKPHFLWNFVLGETDYMVQPVPYDIFIGEYQRRGSSVRAQLLNLMQQEATELVARLLLNARPENRVYRYNYLTENCTTKVRDIVERVIRGEVRYQEDERLTYRDCLHIYTLGHPWAECGDDLLLGANVDTILTDRNSAFLPERLMDYYAQAVIYDSLGNVRPLVLGEPRTLVQKQSVAVAKEFPLSPVACLCCFAALCLSVLALEVLTKRICWGFDLIVMFGMGLCGLFVTFMFFCSEHPTVDSNWQIWLFNPLPLLFMPHVVWRAIKRRFTPYHALSMVVLLFFLLFSPWIPQRFAIITLPLACSLLTRPISYYIYYSRMNLHWTRRSKTVPEARKKKRSKA